MSKLNAKSVHRPRPATTATTDNIASANYKLDTTRTILSGLIHTPYFGPEQTSSAFDQNQNPTNELDFQPPVPHSTATLLSMAEEKIKAMSNSVPQPNKRGGGRGMNRKGQPGTSRVSTTMTTQLKRQTLPTPESTKAAKVFTGKSVSLNDNHTTSSTHPLKWLRGEQAELKSKRRSQSRTRHSKSTPSPSNKLKEIFAPEEPDKLITIGGYIINIEKGLPPQMITSVRPMVTSNERGIEIEVRLKEVDPTKIVVEKRYNSILVIGVKESGLKPPRASLPASDTSVPFGFEDDVIEVVNIFAPRDISLTRVMVTQADSKGRLFIKAP